MVPSAEEDQYDVSDKDGILDKDCNNEYEEEDSNRQEGTEDIIDTTSQAVHYHNASNTVDDNNTTEENRNKSSASPALANIVGTMNKHRKIYKGHYEPWLTQHINDLRLQLVLPAIYNEPGVHKYALHLAESDEGFGISILLRSLMDLYNIRAADNSFLSTKNRTLSSDLASLIILHSSTAHTAGPQYRFMTQRRGAAHAIISVQAQVERNKYDSLT